MSPAGNPATYFLSDSEVAKFRLQRLARHTRRVVRETEQEHGLSSALSHGHGRLMALHAAFPNSPYETLLPEFRWFPAAEELRSTAYEKLLPPLVAHIREAVRTWRDADYAGASATSIALLNWWFKSNHLTEQADGYQSIFRYYFAQREAVETIIWLYDVRGTRDKFDLLRFDASGAVSANMFDEAWPRFVVKMATGAGKTKVLSLLMAWSYFHRMYETGSDLSRNFLLIAPNIILITHLAQPNLL